MIPRAGRRAWVGLAVLGLPTILLALDLSVVYLALPRLSADLGASNIQQLWITDIYGFVTAGFLVTMGTLGDRIGRRRLLLIGAAAFGATSALAAFSTSAAMLIGARALMGVAGATLMPSTLALITNMFVDRAERATAIAAWTSCFMVGAAVGPIVGGVLLQYFWWGSLFLLGVPVMLLLLITGPFLLPEYRDATAGRLDAASVALSLSAILPAVYAIKTLAHDGVAVIPFAAAAVGLLAGAAFVKRQRRLASPLLDVRLFRNRAFSAALLILMVGIATQGGIMLLVSEHLQIVDGLSPLRAGWSLMPASVAMVVGCLAAPVAARVFRQGTIIACGLAISGCGYALIALVEGSADVGVLIAGAILVFFGIGPMAVFSQDLVVSSAPPGSAGSAAALSETSGDFGIALGVAVFGSISAAIYRHRLVAFPPALPVSASEVLARSRSAFTAGLHAAAICSAVISVGLAVISFTAISRVPSDAGAAEGD
jgi:DHA2 family multidrug resistance protein-like MFS transporter